MTSWRAARSLLTLRDQINAAYPTRDKGADGTIGDAAHTAEGTGSDHNPDRYGIVRALDIDADLGAGHNSAEIAQTLLDSRDARIKYVISRARIAYSTAAFAAYYGDAGTPPWTWTTYYGDDPHTGHFHISVVPDARADDPKPWTITHEEDDMTPAQAKQLADTLAAVNRLQASLDHNTTLVYYGDSKAAALGQKPQTHPANLFNINQRLTALTADLAALRKELGK